VGTFPVQPSEVGAPPSLQGVVAPGAPGVLEQRRVLEASMADLPPEYVDRLAVGATGFNVPALVGMAVAGSYFHAGNARTLEEVFDATFAEHHRHPAVAPELALTAEDVRALVSFLLSIDEHTVPMAVPALDADGAAFDPDLCAQL
jgi:hypothetical protein